MPSKLKEVPIAELFVSCSYRMTTPSVWGSKYPCGQPADTAVEHANGNRYYRCPEHSGLMIDTVTGPVHETVLIRVDIPEGDALS